MYIPNSPNEVVATEVPEEWEKEEKSKVRVRVLDLRSPKERLVTAFVRESLRPEVDHEKGEKNKRERREKESS